MKKRYTILSSLLLMGAFVFGTEVANAQSFRLARKHLTITVTGVWNDVGAITVEDTVYNLSGSDLALSWRMLENDADTPNAGYSLCDNKNCYYSANMPGSVEMNIIPAGGHGGMKYGFEQKAPSSKKSSTAKFLVQEVMGTYSDTITFTVNHFTSIAERENALQFALYPNPSRTVLAVQSDDVMKGYSIHDVSGRLVRSGSFANLKKEIAVDGLSSGLYTLRLVNARGEAGSRLFVKE